MRLDHITPKGPDGPGGGRHDTRIRESYRSQLDHVVESPGIRVLLRQHATVTPDDHSERVPPDPMPNSAVKPLSADGSVGPPHARVGHRQAFIPKIPSTKVLGIFLWAGGAPLFTWWGRFAGRPLAGSGRSTALVAVPRDDAIRIAFHRHRTVAM